MTTCPACGAVGEDDSAYCATCGTPRKLPPLVPHESAAAARAATAVVVPRYCAICGCALASTAVACPACGTSVSSMALARTSPKSKAVAVVLAIFFSGFAWLYLYQKCARKFWIFIAVTVGTFVVFAITTVVALGSLVSSGDLLSVASVVFLLLSIVAWMAVHLWSIVDVCVKDDDWYRSFD